VLNVAENTTAILTMAASDADGDTLRWSLGGADAAKLIINPSTGALSFISAPDFEAPGDADANNRYEVTVQATDSQGASDSQSLTITVSNTNDAPSGSVTVSGIPALGQTLTASHTLADPDGPSPLTGITYQWFAGSSAIAGATGVALLLTQAQVGQTITVQASYTDALGNATRVSSAATAAVDDNDGVVKAVEDAVPGLPASPDVTPIPGDGNGDGTPDSAQSGVTSAAFLNTPSAVSQPGNAAATFVTLVADAKDGKPDSTDANSASLSNVKQLDAPTDLPAGIQMPLGRISFAAHVGQSTATPAVGITETFSLYLDANKLADGSFWVNGYWKQDSAGNWVNLAHSLTVEGNRLRLDFQLTDGGEFDSDGVINGTIVDPGAPAFGQPNMPTLQQQVMALYVAYYDRAPDAGGLQYWLDQAQGGMSLNQISAGFAAHPRFEQDYGGLTNAQIAARLYQNVLHREGDTGGLAYWSAQLQSHPTSDVVLAFVYSALSVDLSAALANGSLALADYSLAYERQNVIYNLLHASQQFVDAFGSQTAPTATPDNLSQDTAYQAAISVLNAIDSDPNAVYTQSAQLASLIGQPDAMAQVVALLR